MADEEYEGGSRVPVLFYAVVSVLALLGLISIWGMLVGIVWTVVKVVLFVALAYVGLILLKRTVWGRREKRPARTEP